MKNSIFSLALRVTALICLLAATGCEVISESGSNDDINSAAASAENAPADSTDGGVAANGERGSSDIPSDWQWIYGSDISHWPVTINLSSATVYKGSTIHHVNVEYDRLQDIPAYYVPGDPNNVHNVNGTIWLVREYQGQMYIGTIDYLRVGQKSKEFASSPAFMFDPRPGDRVGFMVSTMNRSYDGTIVRGDPNSPYKERSNIFWVTW